MKRLFRLFFRLLLFAFFIIAGIMAVQTVGFSSRQIPVDPVAGVPVDPQAIDRFSRALQFPTVSSDEGLDTAAFLLLDTFVRRAYPRIDSLLEKISAAPLSMVFKWPGSNPHLPPVLLLGHLDVVPAEHGESDYWEAPPFSGKIQDGYIWGRGALDDKINVFSILEAIEQLLAEDYQPNRSIYLAFGHDEEIGGTHGAARTADLFKEKGIHFEFVLDEGSVIVENALPGLDAPLAMIGIAEKTSVTLQLQAQLAEGGHSSMPPPETAVGVLSKAIDRLQQHPFPARISGPTRELFEYVGPEMSMPYKVLFANLWLTEGLLIRQFSKDPASNAMVRTTTAPTVIRGGVKDNVLPSEATALVNFRILPGESLESVIAYVNATIDDERVAVQVIDNGFGAAILPASATGSFGYQIIQKTIQQIFPDVVIAPSLVIGATDSRHFVEVSDHIYRFMPVQLTPTDLKRIHGRNERIQVEAYQKAIRYYRQLILNSGK